MTDETRRSPARPDPERDALALVLYRLEQIERRMDRLLTAELYTARHEALQTRVRELEAKREESDRTMRQMVVGMIVAVGTALVTAGLTFT